jgi:hypothetical protein
MHRISSTVLIVFSALFLSQAVYAQPQPDQGQDKEVLILRGEVLDARFEPIPETEGYFKILIRFKLEFVNTGKLPALIVTDGLPFFRRQVITLNSGSLDKEIILNDEPGVSSLSDEAGWRSLRTRLDKPSPPKDLVTVIAPGGKWESENSTVVRGTVKLGKKHYAKPFQAYPTSLDWFTTISPVYIRFQVEFWSALTEKRPDQRSMPFGHKLRKRWKSYGDLQLGSVLSEPIRLDLPGVDGSGSAVSPDPQIDR